MTFYTLKIGNISSKDEVVRAATRVALCNRLDAFLEQAAKARKAIVDFDRTADDRQEEIFPRSKPVLPS